SRASSRNLLNFRSNCSPSLVYLLRRTFSYNSKRTVNLPAASSSDANEFIVLSTSNLCAFGVSPSDISASNAEDEAPQIVARSPCISEGLIPSSLTFLNINCVAIQRIPPSLRIQRKSQREFSHAELHFATHF